MDVLADSVKDTLQLIPFLFVTYLAMEALEHGTSGHAERIIAQAGKAGPILGAGLGAIPQCGFSAMAATLYAGRVVTVGTLVAVILSTSDELVPVLLAHQEPPSMLFTILATKAAIGMVAGLVVDLVIRMLHREGDGKPHIHELCERSHCGCEDVEDEEDGGVGQAGHAPAHHHGHDHEHGSLHGRLWSIARSAFVHTVEVTVFIFLISLAFGFLIEWVGQEELATFLGIHPVRATFLAALIGLIPNCGASVAIAELYTSGTLATGPMLAGLLASGGVGLLVLFRTNRDLRQNLAITALVYVVGVVVGLVAGALGIII